MAVHNGGRVECAAVKRVHSANGERDWRTRLANANGEREKRNEKRAYIQKRCALAARKPVVAFEIGSTSSERSSSSTCSHCFSSFSLVSASCSIIVRKGWSLQ